MLLADTHLTAVTGVDVHMTAVPPYNPVHPYIGIVVDPADYIPFLGTNVTINGLKRGVSDTSGVLLTLVHIPLVGSFVNPSMIGHESMNFFSSQNVFSDGSRLSPKGYMVMTCNDIGLPLSATLEGNKAKKRKSLVPTLFAPTSFSLPVPTGKPVYVGDPYIPDIGGAMEGMFYNIGFSVLKKVGISKFNTKILQSKVMQKVPGTQKLSDMLCKMGFEPVDLVGGVVVYEGLDFSFPSPVPLSWKRSWYSDSNYVGWLGHGVHCIYDRCVQELPQEGATALRMEDGRIVAFPMIPQGKEMYLREERTTLRHTETGYEAYSHDTMLTSVFDLRCGDGHTFRMTRLTNPDGMGTELRFSNGKPETITDAAGRCIRVETEQRGFITRISLETIKGTEMLVVYEYDKDGNMMSITDALGQTTHILYDGHLMTENTDRNGDTFHWEYDGKGRCVHTWGKDGIQEGRIEYHPEKGFNLVTDAMGGTTTYRYRPDRIVTAEEDPLGNITRYEYTEYSEPYRVTDPEGRITGYGYDEKGNLTSVTYPDGTEETYIYDELDRLVIHVDACGNKAQRLYDKERKHLMTRTIDRTGEITKFDYDKNGMLVAMTRGEQISKLVYDEQHNLVSWNENGKTLRRWDYDHRGQVTAEHSPLLRPDRFEYDALGRVTRVYAHDGNTVELGYDAYDSVTEARDAHRHVRMTYTPLGSLATRTEGEREVKFLYDRMERLTDVVNERGDSYSFIRDKAGQVCTERGFDGMTRNYIRNRTGETVLVERPGGRGTAYEYDARGRMCTVSYHDGTKEEYSYDKNGNLVMAANASARIRLERDAAGRIIRESMELPAGDTPVEVTSVESEYDGYGNRTRVRSSLGADVRLDYDSFGLVSGVNAGCGKEDNPKWESGIRRDDAGREVERFATGGIRIATDYDDTGMVRSRHVYSNGRHTGFRSYRWDVGARLMSMRCNLSAEPVIFDYDSVGNLIRGEYGMFDRIFRTPDLVGNIYRDENRRDRTYDRGGRLLSDGEFHYSYDCEGNLVHKSRRNLTEAPKAQARHGFLSIFMDSEKTEANNTQAWQPGDTCYTWLANGMLESVITPDGKTVTFEYDALGRRTAKTSDRTAKIFCWDGNVLLHEWECKENERPRLVTDDMGRESYDREVTFENVITWVYDGQSFTPVAKVTEQERYTIVHDYLGTPTQAYDSKGKLVWEMLLDVYGNAKEYTGEKCFVPFRYQGHYEDKETHQYYNRFRYYSPKMGMYISSDPIGLAGGNPTLYGYVFDPNTQVDPFGLDCDKVNKARARQHKMLQDNKGFNISPTDWDAYPSIGRNGTFITDCKGALGYFGNFKKGDTITISSVKAAKIESDMGLNPGSLQNGFKIREVSGISSMNPRSPLEGNEYFLGGGQHLPGGAPEMVINSIPTTDNASVTTILTVLVK